MLVFPYSSTLCQSRSMNFSKDGIWIEYIEIIYSRLSERQTIVVCILCRMEWLAGNDNDDA